MIEVTSKNRLAARRLLTQWHNASDVRAWPLHMLDAAVQNAITQGLITREAAERALAYDPSVPATRTTDTTPATGGNGAYGEPVDAGDDSEAEDTGSASESEDDGEADDTGEADSDSDAADGEADGEANDADDENNDDDSEASQPEADKPEAQPAASNDPLAALIQAMIDKSIGHHRETDKHGAESVKRLRVEVKGRPVVDMPDGTHERLPLVIRYLAAGLNVALVGPAGSGKSTLTAQAFKALGREVRGCGALTSQFQLTGYQDAGGTYHASPLFDAWTNGHGFCFDEFDGSSPDAAIAFNAATDGQNVFTFPHGMFPKHKDFLAVACMNTWGLGADADYVGRFKQDAAAMSRFVRVHIDYDRALEARLADAAICARVWSLRDACKSLAIRHVVSTRMIVQAQAALSAGVSKADVDRDVFFSGLPAATVTQVKGVMKNAS